MKNENKIAPASSNPDTGRSVAAALADAGAAPPPPAPPMPKAKTRIAGADLVPDIGGLASNAGVVRQFRYWVGVTASCPVNGVDLAGINFPKTNEQLIDDPGRTNEKRRRLVAGSIVWLTEEKIRLIRERLPRTVIRYSDEAAVIDEPGTGENIGDVAQRPAHARLITIPSAEDVAERRRKGKHVRHYVPDPKRDVPAARFMFAQLCPDQERPTQGEYYPDPLEITGLEWPDEIAERDDAVARLLR